MLAALQAGVNNYIAKPATVESRHEKTEQTMAKTGTPTSVTAPFKLAIIPDTQWASRKWPEVLKSTTKWIAANHESMDIKYVLHVGDMVETGGFDSGDRVFHVLEHRGEEATHAHELRLVLADGVDEARLVLECRKIYEDDLKKKNFLLPEVAKKNYPKNDFHKFYMGEIVNVLIR